MEMYRLTLSLFQSARILVTDMDSKEFIDMIAPSIRDQVPAGNYFYISGNDRDFYYDRDEDGRDFISYSRGSRPIYLPEEKSFIRSFMDSISNNQLTNSINTIKESFNPLGRTDD